MNRLRLPFTAIVALLLVFVAVAGVLLWNARATPPVGRLAGSGLGGAYMLIDQTGRTVTAATFAGRYPLYYFGYTFCPDVCPLDVANLSKGLALFEKADPRRAALVQPIFVSVDPERDTPAVLRSWLAAFHPRFVGLTGTPAQVDAMKHAFRVYARRSGTGADYLVDHSAVTYLFGPDAQPVSFIERDAAPAAVAAELDKYVR